MLYVVLDPLPMIVLFAECTTVAPAGSENAVVISAAPARDPPTVSARRTLAFEARPRNKAALGSLCID